MAKNNATERRNLRHARCRKKISGTAERPRLSLYISNKYIYTQIIDDTAGKTLASASTFGPELREQAKGKSRTEAAKIVGAAIADAGKKAGVTRVVFDKSGYKYGMRLSALADAAREAGLEF